MLPLLLFASGFCALVYQTLWLRSLGLVLGVTVYAASTVLAAFMAGLAVGSLIAGRLADRVRAPLRWFGAAEILIGLSALATPLFLDALEALYRQVYSTVSSDLAVLTPVRFGASFLVLLIPTSLMGATMPLAVRAAVQRAPEIGGRVAVLYAANTAGALTGALLTGYVLIGSIGISASFRVAAACNVLVGVAALLWARGVPVREPRRRETAPPGAVTAQPVRAPYGRSLRALVLMVFGISGFVSLALEVVWFRALVLFLQATTYAFTTILALVLAGIAIGSAVARVILRRERDWILWLGCLEMGVAVAAAGSLALLARTFNVLWTRGASVEVAALAVLPATVALGIAFPIGLHYWAASSADDRTGDSVGLFYMVNLAGGIAGALAGGFLLIGTLGTKGSLIAVSALSLVAGLGLLAARVRERPMFVTAAGVAGVAAFAGVSARVPQPIDAVMSARFPGEQVLWRAEDPQVTVTVQSQRGRLLLYMDGNHQASNSPDMLSLHRLIGLLGPAIHPDPRDVLVIGLGGGVTAGAAARFSTADIDIIELSPGVITAADWFADASGQVLKQPSVRVRVDDGRNHLLLTAKKYDVITADIIQPFHAGAGNLYSREYFQLAANALNDGGLMVQWIGRRPDTQYKLIARTFLDVFPHTTVWADGTLLLGATQPLTVSLSAMHARMGQDLGRALAFAGIFGVGGLMSRYVAGPDELRALVGAGPLLTDDRPRLEFFRSLPADEPDAAVEALKGSVERHFVP